MKSSFTYILSFILLFSQPIFAGATKKSMPGNGDNNLNTAKHPVHISFTNVEYNSGKGKFEILFKFFIDDFDKILSIKYGKNLNLTEGKWEKDYVDIIDQYILEHFKLKIGTKEKTRSYLKFVRKEISDGSIWLYYDFNSKEKSNKFEVYNSLMTDLYQDQNNLLVFTYLGEQRAFKFSVSNSNEAISF